MFAKKDAAYGRLDVLVNNAGIYSFEPSESMTEEDFRRHFDTNVLGVTSQSRKP